MHETRAKGGRTARTRVASITADAERKSKAPATPDEDKSKCGDDVLMSHRQFDSRRSQRSAAQSVSHSCAGVLAAKAALWP